MDLIRFDERGRGVISVINLKDIQDKPRLFSSLMLFLLVETYGSFQEVGDLEKPKLVLIIDEAHLLFEGTSKALLDKLESVVRLIRSKGVGILLSTQTPTDIPKGILGQLGLKIQHALRAFTANDRKAIKLASENFPTSPFYDVKKLLTQMAIGEALVTALNERGVPTPLVETMIRSPKSYMGPISDEEVLELIRKSPLRDKYETRLDRESAYEILKRREESVGSGAGGHYWDFVVKTTFFRKLYNTVVREIINSVMKIVGFKRR
jgi:DNA helicase HerA-like ATPase